MNFSQLLGSFIPFIERLALILRATLGVILVFFLPVFVWTFFLFSRLSVLKRVVVSSGLLIAVILSIILLNLLLGIRIHGPSAVVTIILITAIVLVLYWLKGVIIHPRMELSWK